MDSDDAVDQAWNLIYHKLVSLKLSLLTEENLQQSATDLYEIQFRNRSNSNSSAESRQRLALAEKRTNEWVEKLYEIYCDVWQTQGHTKTPAFITAVYEKAITVAIAARCSSALVGLHDHELRTSCVAPNSGARDRAFRDRMRRLSERWKTKLDIEAKELGHHASVHLSRTISQASPPVVRKRSPRPKSLCFQAALNVLRTNPRLSLERFCRLMDSKAEQYPTSLKYRPPENWRVRTFMEQYRKRSNTVSRFLTSVRKELVPSAAE